jgi:hypothetical protein
MSNNGRSSPDILEQRPRRLSARLRNSCMSIGAIVLIFGTMTIGEISAATAQSGSYAPRGPTKQQTQTIPGIAPAMESPVVTFAPTRLDGSSSIQLITTPSLSKLGTELISSIRKTHREFNDLFGGITDIHNILRLIDAEEFYAVTHLPNWTNAMFFRKQVVIPIDRSKPIDRPELERSLRHEYFHAITHALSAGRCPGWLDEGLAQHIEGVPQDGLWKALSGWLGNNEMVPFERLGRGFTKLPGEMVAPAYAQSLVAARMVRSQFGMGAIRVFLERLKSGGKAENAFLHAFGIPPTAFHKRVEENLRAGKFRRGDFG